MSKRKNIFDLELEAEEKELEEALPDSWDKLPFSANQAWELKLAEEMASEYLRKEAKINIRLTRHDVDGLRRIAVREGLPYQTLIASILHKYVNQHIE